MDCFVAFAPRNDATLQMCARDLAAAFRASSAKNFPPSEIQRAQGMPGARCARSLVCKKTNTRVSHHGHTGFTRHSPRNGFTAYFALFPVTMLV
jgi:hypothetical protein